MEQKPPNSNRFSLRSQRKLNPPCSRRPKKPCAFSKKTTTDSETHKASFSKATAREGSEMYETSLYHRETTPSASPQSISTKRSSIAGFQAKLTSARNGIRTHAPKIIGKKFKASLKISTDEKAKNGAVSKTKSKQFINHFSWLFCGKSKEAQTQPK